MSRRTPQELAADAARKRERRLRFKREGMCAVCGKEKPAPDRVACEVCLEDAGERSLKCWHDNDGLQKYQERTSRHRVEGRCACGQPLANASRNFSDPNREKLSKCEACHERAQKSRRPAA